MYTQDLVCINMKNLKILMILHYGKEIKKDLIGIHHGDQEDLVGILNALQCLRMYLVHI